MRDTVTTTHRRHLSKKKIKEIKRRLKRAGLTYKAIAVSCKPEVSEKMVQFVVNGQKTSSTNVIPTINRLAPPIDNGRGKANG